MNFICRQAQNLCAKRLFVEGVVVKKVIGLVFLHAYESQNGLQCEPEEEKVYFASARHSQGE